MMDRFSDRHPIVLNAPDHAVNVHADGERFQRVLESLINNAIKYSPDGGMVELSISADRDAVVRVPGLRHWHLFGGPAANLRGVISRARSGQMRARTGPRAENCVTGDRTAGGTIEAAPAQARGTIVTVRLPLARVPREEHVGSSS